MPQSRSDIRRTPQGTSRRRVLAGALGAVGVAGLAACGVGQGSAISVKPDTRLKVGVLPVADFAPLYIAADRGLFAARGLNVTTQVMQNAAAIAPSVINGQLAFGSAATPPFIGAYAKTLPLLAVANNASVSASPEQDPSALVAAPQSKIRRPRDFEGQTVAVNALSSIVHVTAAAVIKEDGGDPSAVRFVAMPFPDMLPALKKGAIAGASLVEPFYVQAAGLGCRVLAHPYSATLQRKGTFSLVFTAGPFAEKNPETVNAFRSAVEEATQIAATDRAAVGAVLGKYGKLKPEVFAKMRLPLYSRQLSEPAIGHTAELMHSLGFLPSVPSMSGAIYR